MACINLLHVRVCFLLRYSRVHRRTQQAFFRSFYCDDGAAGRGNRHSGWRIDWGGPSIEVRWLRPQAARGGCFLHASLSPSSFRPTRTWPPLASVYLSVLFLLLLPGSCWFHFRCFRVWEISTGIIGKTVHVLDMKHSHVTTRAYGHEQEKT